MSAIRVRVTENGVERVDKNRSPKKMTVVHTDSFGAKKTYSLNLPEDIQTYLADYHLDYFGWLYRCIN